MDIFLKDELFQTESDSSSSSSEDKFDLIALISSDSSDDEVRVKRVRIEDFVEVTVPSYSDHEFKSHFRMGRKTAYSIIDLFKESTYIPKQKQGREKITAEKSFFITLWYLGNQESLRQVADRFNVTESSVFRMLNRVINFLISISKSYIVWPSQAKAQEISEKFKQKHGICGIIGAIDGSHIPIKKPIIDQECFVNRKGYHSIVLQGTVDDRKKFIDVFCGEAGSQHDARVLRKSSLYEKGETGVGFYGKYFLLGDSAYPSKNWLVPPFKDNGHLTRDQKSFNFIHSSTRIVVEHAFGLLKERFRRLYHFENITLSFIIKCTVAACILDNICIDAGDGMEYSIETFDDIEPVQDIDMETPNAEINDKRSKIFYSMFNK